MPKPRFWAGSRDQPANFCTCPTGRKHPNSKWTPRGSLSSVPINHANLGCLGFCATLPPAASESHLSLPPTRLQDTCCLPLEAWNTARDTLTLRENQNIHMDCPRGEVDRRADQPMNQSTRRLLVLASKTPKQDPRHETRGVCRPRFQEKMARLVLCVP